MKKINIDFNKEFNLVNGDSYEVLKNLPDNCIDSIVTDPPYGLSKQPDLNKVLGKWLNDEVYKSPSKGFMGNDWDSFVPSPLLWKECFRVLKPGGHILAFAGTRTQHLMAMSLGLAGFEIRDVIFWVYGSGFPKSQNISKAIDKLQCNERIDCGFKYKSGKPKNSVSLPAGEVFESKSTSPDGIKWEGWGTGLKPAVEPITLARKPISEKTIAKNVLKHGTGGINIDDCRIETKDNLKRLNNVKGIWSKDKYEFKTETGTGSENGRFPSNLIIEENDLNLSILQEKSKYFYSPKCQKKDRNEGLEEFEEFEIGTYNFRNDCSLDGKKTKSKQNTHPTVKPTELMAYLCKLITPKNGIILDPFNGSGSTGKAAVREDFRYLGIDLDSEYIKISQARIEFEINKKQSK